MGSAIAIGTHRALPQLFSYVQSPREADRALEIIDLKTEEFGPKSSSELEIQKSLIREMAVAKARALLPSRGENDIKILKLDDSNLPLSKVRNESGFRLVDTAAVRAGDGANAELVTVVFAKSAADRSRLVPLVFAHAGDEEYGWKIKEAIDQWCREIHGDVAENLIHSRTQKYLNRFVQRIDEIKAKLVVGAAIAAVGIAGLRGAYLKFGEYRADRLEMQKQAQVEQDKSRADYKARAQERHEFIKTTLASIKSSEKPATKTWLLDQIQLQHYDTLLNIMDSGTQAEKIEAATTLKELVEIELITKRSEVVWRSAGPFKNPDQSWRLEDWKMAHSLLKDYVHTAFKNKTDPELRAILLSTYELIPTPRNLR